MPVKYFLFFSFYLLFQICCGSQIDSIQIKKILLEIENQKKLSNKKFNLNNCLVLVDSVINSSKKINYEKGILKGYTQKGILLFHAYQESEIYLDSALFYAKKLNASSDEALIKKNLIEVYIANSDLEKAEKAANEAIEIYNKTQPNLAQEIESRLIMILFNSGQYEAAIEMQILNQLNTEKFGNRRSIFFSCLNSSKLFSTLHNCEKAEIYSNRMLSLCADSAVATFKYKAFLQAGNMQLYCLKNNNKAIEYYQKGLSEVQGTYLENERLSMLFKISEIYLKLKNYEESEKILLELLNYPEFHDLSGKVNLYLNLSTINCERGKYSESRELAEKALLYANFTDNIGQIIGLYNVISKTYRSEKNYKLAHEYLYKKDSLEGIISAKKNENLFKKYDENFLLSKQNAMIEKMAKKEEKENIQLLLENQKRYFIGYFVFSIIIIIFLIYKLKQKTSSGKGKT